MARAKKSNYSSSSNNQRRIRPALSPEARENQLMSLTIDLVE